MSYQTRKKQQYDNDLFEESDYEPGASLYDDYVRDNPVIGSRPTYRSSYSGSLGVKPEYSDSYGGEMQALWKQYVNRKPFSYDAAKDPLYQSYRDRYVQEGKLAMRDTMGRAAALTGGYGSTYGQQVGQQSYDSYLKSLSDVIPQLYGMAYGRYQDEGDNLLTQYKMLGNMRDDEYGRYRDELADWEAERAYRDAQEARDYARYRDELADWEAERSYLAGLEAEDYRRATAADETAYQREQDTYNRRQQSYSTLYATIRETGYSPTDAELQAAGMSRETAKAIAAEYSRNANYDERNMSLKEMSANGDGFTGSNWTGYDPVLGSYYYEPGGGSGGGSSRSSGSKSSGGGGYSAPEYSAPAYTAYDTTYNTSRGTVTVNPYGEARTGDQMTRGEIDREARRAYNAGEITKQEYDDIRRSLH